MTRWGCNGGLQGGTTIRHGVRLQLLGGKQCMRLAVVQVRGAQVEGLHVHHVGSGAAYAATSHAA